jgi:hypothetical protein
MAAFNLEAGTSTESCLTMAALRIRLSISAIGSEIVTSSLTFSLPASFPYPGNPPGESQLSKTDATQAELADIGAWSAAPVAPVVLLNPVFGGTRPLGDF